MRLKDVDDLAIETAEGGFRDAPLEAGGPSPVYYAPPPSAGVVIEPPVGAPVPVAVEWAPPPMLVEPVPPLPYFGAVWVGGYWTWEGDWVWARGRWAGPPSVGYEWT